jgi:arylsulfatase A-like enzyme
MCGWRTLLSAGVIAASACASTAAIAAAPAERPPNVVIVVTDDLGYGDLGVYGHPVHRTPNLDRLAAEGQRWTDFYSAAAVCTPSRGSLLTGRLPARLGLESPRGAPNVFLSQSTGGLPHDELTLAELLGRRGYATALIGKWHLGPTPEHSPLTHGFEYFFGTPSSNDHDPVGGFSMQRFFEEPPDSAHWDVLLYRNREVIERPARQETLTQRFTDEALAFVQRNRDRPFFVVLAYTMPHVPLFASERFRGHSLGGLYADVVEELDANVGRFVDAVRELGPDRPTLVVFTSDNGPIELFRDRGGSPGPLRGGKNTTWEAGLRVPTIFWGPSVVARGTVHGIGSQLDLFATVAELAGAPLPTDRLLDGRSLRATVATLAPSPRQRIYYYRNGEIYAIRDARLKAHFTTEDAYGADTRRTEQDPPLVFDLATDPGERFPVTASAETIAEFRRLRTEQQQAVPLAASQLGKGITDKKSE